MSDDLKPGGDVFPQPAQLDAEGRAAQKRRNMWLGLALLGFVVLVGLTTAVRLSGSDSRKAEFYYNMKSTSAPDEAPALPPGMTPDQAAPPPNLSEQPVVEEDVIIEEKAPEQ
jgi:hypothetical protein